MAPPTTFYPADDEDEETALLEIERAERRLARQRDAYDDDYEPEEEAEEEAEEEEEEEEQRGLLLRRPPPRVRGRGRAPNSAYSIRAPPPPTRPSRVVTLRATPLPVSHPLASQRVFAAGGRGGRGGRGGQAREGGGRGRGGPSRGGLGPGPGSLPVRAANPPPPFEWEPATSPPETGFTPRPADTREFWFPRLPRPRCPVWTKAPGLDQGQFNTIRGVMSPMLATMPRWSYYVIMERGIDTNPAVASLDGRPPVRYEVLFYQPPDDHPADCRHCFAAFTLYCVPPLGTDTSFIRRIRLLRQAEQSDEAHAEETAGDQTVDEETVDEQTVDEETVEEEAAVEETHHEDVAEQSDATLEEAKHGGTAEPNEN